LHYLNPRDRSFEEAEVSLLLVAAGHCFAHGTLRQ